MGISRSKGFVILQEMVVATGKALAEASNGSRARASGALSRRGAGDGGELLLMRRSILGAALSAERRDAASAVVIDGGLAASQPRSRAAGQQWCVEVGGIVAGEESAGTGPRRSRTAAARGLAGCSFPLLNIGRHPLAPAAAA